MNYILLFIYLKFIQFNQYEILIILNFKIYNLSIK